MLADHFRRHQQRRVALDVGAFHRVDAIGRPHAVSDRKNAQIDTAAAGGAAFDFQTGVRGLQIGEDAVTASVCACAAGRPVSGETSSVTSLLWSHFDVVDAELADELVHRTVNIVVRVRVGEVDNLLGASLHRQAARGGLQDPVRMVAEQVGIGVDHFRLEPQAEFEALAVHVVGERLEGLVSVGPNVL